MKNAVLSGGIIGILSILWIFLMPRFGVMPQKDVVSPAEYFSFVIPAIGLFFGIMSYRKNECNGQMGFLEALFQSFKILIVGGIIAVFGSILYISYVSSSGSNIKDFSERIFGALIVGILLAFAVSLIFTNRANKVD
ncbi:DUF4199 domain-containing protein [Mucilaginibacter celer]|uniref:DUF4199 family protein n=1 Tax=Mucilaginibacter celer TaxID=2305508 RepID=A0A494VUL4_9SPHI|nr:DUF4199 domain-containing protein [Mucilaginibacter celer]AYL98079.1 DUF4199 family protein [Mucilaginibacter celer]